VTYWGAVLAAPHFRSGGHQAFGGKPLVRGGQSETPEGAQFTRHVCFEYPDYETAKAAYYSPEYQEIMKIRVAHADSMIVLVEGAD